MNNDNNYFLVQVETGSSLAPNSSIKESKNPADVIHTLPCQKITMLDVKWEEGTLPELTEYDAAPARWSWSDGRTLHCIKRTWRVLVVVFGYNPVSGADNVGHFDFIDGAG